MRPRQILMVPIALAVIGLAFAFTIPGTFQCKGEAACFSGTVTGIADGGTIVVDGRHVRLALASAPDWHSEGGAAASFLEGACPVGSTVLVDEDDGSPGGAYGQVSGVVYCGGGILNRALLESGHGTLDPGSCRASEFAAEWWAREHGC